MRWVRWKLVLNSPTETLSRIPSPLVSTPKGNTSAVLFAQQGVTKRLSWR